MVCLYCSGDTQVVNSRPQKRANSVWRRRKCLDCGAIFSSSEQIDLSQAISVRRTITSPLEPFTRDLLFVSIYDSLRHRPTALRDATELTATIITKLHPFINQATLAREHIVTVATKTLEHFDVAAATHYRAFHPATRA